MKTLKLYSEFIKESVLDFLKPKSDEVIIKELEDKYNIIDAYNYSKDNNFKSGIIYFKNKILSKNVDELDKHERAMYYNLKLNKDIFEIICQFNYANGNIALSVLKNKKFKFINRKGEISTNGITNDDIDKMDTLELKTYYNQKIGKDIFEFINEFKYANGNIALALLKNYKYKFINRNGDFSVNGITDDDIDKLSKHEKACYYNQKLGKEIFIKINPFIYANGQIAMSILDNEVKFINRKGELSVNGITDYDINSFDKYTRANYYNQKLNEELFDYITDFKYVNGKIAFARLYDIDANYGYAFINKNGEIIFDDALSKDVNNMNEIERATYYNIKLNKKIFKKINSFNIANNKLALAELKNGEYKIINRKGEPSIKGITKNIIDEMNRKERAAYYNQKLGKDLFREVHYFNYANDEIAFSVLKNGKKKFINRKGEFSIKGMTDTDIMKLSVIKKQTYEKQLKEYK